MIFGLISLIFVLILRRNEKSLIRSPKLSALKLGAFFGGVVYADRDLICHYSVGFRNLQSEIFIAEHVALVGDPAALFGEPSVDGRSVGFRFVRELEEFAEIRDRCGAENSVKPRSDH